MNRLGSFGTQSLQGRTLTYCMLDTIGRAIVTGRYDETGFPTEAELSEQYGVSRTVTREAVKMLAAKGLLTARPRLGTAIEAKVCWNVLDTDVLGWLLSHRSSIHLLRQLIQLCAAIEPEAAALAAEHASEQERELIVSNLTLLVKGKADPESMLNATIEFHSAILRACQNPFFAQLQTMVANFLSSSLYFTIVTEHGREMAHAHAELRRAVVRRRSNAAKSAMHSIISSTIELIDADDWSSRAACRTGKEDDPATEWTSGWDHRPAKRKRPISNPEG